MSPNIRKTEDTRGLRGRRPGSWGGIALAACALWTGCIQVQEMANQPRLEALEPSEFFGDGIAARPQVVGTIARDEPWEQTPELSGRRDGELVDEIPLEVTAQLLERGSDRFRIFCRHCHGWSGYGDGMVVQRGFPAPPSYHIERLHAVSDGHMFEVITNGIGRMPALGARIPPHERWAIVSYVRALQLSQRATMDMLEDQDRARLETQTTSSPETQQ